MTAVAAGPVSTAFDSVLAYENWLASGQPQDWRASPVLREIRDYNRDDCESTWQLTEWLRERQCEAGIAWLPPGTGPAKEGEDPQRSTEPNPRHELAERLLADIPQLEQERAGDTQRWQTQEMLGNVVEFHRREDKPVWWATFDRQAMSEQELVEDLDCLGGLLRESDRPIPIKRSAGFWYTFDPDQDTKLTQGASCFFAHDLDMTTDIHALDRDHRPGVSEVWSAQAQAAQGRSSSGQAVADSKRTRLGRGDRQSHRAHRPKLARRPPAVSGSGRFPGPAPTPACPQRPEADPQVLGRSRRRPAGGCAAARVGA